MNRVQLIEKIAAEHNISKAQASRILATVTDTITEHVKNDDPVTIVGFGTFTVAERAARTGRNPQTGETIEIAAAKAPKFRAGKSLKDAVN